MEKSQAVLNLGELLAHFDDEANSYLYKKEDDGSITARMCCQFKVVDEYGSTLLEGSCGDGINYKDGMVSVV